MNISFLLVLLHSWHPPRKHGTNKFVLKTHTVLRYSILMKVTANVTVPFDIDVTHVFSSDACFVQNDVSCVPNDAPQEIPV